MEEAREFADSGDPEELADVLAVVEAIRGHRGIDPDRLEELRAAKAEARGGFEERIVLERVDPDDDPG